LTYGNANDWREWVASQLNPWGIRTASPLRGKAYLEDRGLLQADCDVYKQYSCLSSNRGIITRDRFDTKRCDLLLVNFLGATEKSLGTAMELAWAFDKGTPIVCAMEASGNVHQHGMIMEAIGFQTSTLEEAVHVARSILLDAPPKEPFLGKSLSAA
jgi:hypothetical protein